MRPVDDIAGGEEQQKHCHKRRHNGEQGKQQTKWSPTYLFLKRQQEQQCFHAHKWEKAYERPQYQTR
ncbi:hypothetical protein KTH_51520 [Thermosporothrix hazakensis]|nr:hypothetical protein KTH_51520 [Thermosporothrix hazakensis]